MPSGWDVYYVVFLSALLALTIPGILVFISLLVRQPKAQNASDLSKEDSTKFRGTLDDGATQQKPARRSSDTTLGRKINTRFFLGSNAALVLVTLALFLVPCVGSIKAGLADHGAAGIHGLRGLICIGSIAAFSALGLLYSARKGDLDWVKTYRKKDEIG